MESSKDTGLRSVVLRVLLSFIMLVMIFQLFDNDYIMVLGKLSLAMFGLLTPLTLTSLYRTMWLYRIPVDRRDWTRVWALFGAWVMSNVLHQTGAAEAELF